MLQVGQYPCDLLFFFFQAEDGIRDWSVTGVQTCALPILREHADVEPAFAADRVCRGDAPGFDRLGTEPAAFQGLQAELAEADLVAARRLTFYDAPLAFAELYPFGH